MIIILFSNKNFQLFNGTLFISKYTLISSNVQNALTVNFYSIVSSLTIVSS